jgi:prefoldin subunit 5
MTDTQQPNPEQLRRSITQIEIALKALRSLERGGDEARRRQADVAAHSMMFYSYEELQQSIAQIDDALKPLRKLERADTEVRDEA